MGDSLELALPNEPSRGRPVAARPLPAYPAVERDLALVVADATPVDAVERSAREAAGTLLESVDIFDLYQGEGLPEGTRSVAFRFRWSAYSCIQLLLRTQRLLFLNFNLLLFFQIHVLWS